MKKLLLSIVFITLSMGIYAQTGSKALMPKIGYQTEGERFLVGVEGRFFLSENIRVAPGVSVLFPNNNTWGLDVDANVHYVFPLEGGFAVYPLAGFSMMNNRWSHKDMDSISSTDFGFNIGAGAQYDITDNGYLNFEVKYTFTEGSDPAYFTLGYGIKF